MIKKNSIRQKNSEDIFTMVKSEPSVKRFSASSYVAKANKSGVQKANDLR